MAGFQASEAEQKADEERGERGAPSSSMSVSESFESNG